MNHTTITDPITHSHADRREAGKLIRRKVPRTAHAKWEPAADRPNPVDVLEATNKSRLQDLVPIRFGRMLQSPFAFLRGSAAVMAADLAKTPATGIRVQACGDCHLMNFGAYASPERNLLFDINDFDETLHAPWEWDVKRLAASIVVAGRHIGLSRKNNVQAVSTGMKMYRERLREFAEMRALEVWYSRIDADAWIDMSPNEAVRNRRRLTLSKARLRTVEHVVPKLTEIVNGHRRIIDHPPFVYHPNNQDEFAVQVKECFKSYHRTLQDDRRSLLDRYKLVDVAMKVVGVGSVGTRCAVALLLADIDDPLLLQFKEAQSSVLEPFAGKSPYANHGQRVVCGQRLMQSASDMFLGWSHSEHSGHDFYFRQLRDMKSSMELEEMTDTDLINYAEFCGWALARAHAKSGDAAMIGGYLGKSDAFDDAICEFGMSYADQTEQDYAELVAAEKAGRIVAQSDVEA